MDLGVCQHHPRLRGILDGELRLAVLQVVGIEVLRLAVNGINLQIEDGKHGGCFAVPAATLPLPSTVPHLPGQTPDAP